MAFKVRYNGGTSSFRSCTKPFNLIAGVTYTVMLARDLGDQTNYTLLEEEGEFNSCWFDVVKCTDNTEIGVAGTIPMIAKSYDYSQLLIIDHVTVMKNAHIDKIDFVYYLGSNVYMVKSGDKVLHVLVG